MVQRMAMTNQNLPLAAQVTANQNLHHVVPATVIQNPLPVAQVKVTPSQKPQPVVPHAEAREIKDVNVPGI